jgi:hypothetical protein
MDNGQVLLNGDLTAFRRKRAHELAEQGYSASRITEMLAGDGVINVETGKPYTLSTIRRDLDMPAGDGAMAQVNVAEMIGRNEREKFYRQYMPQFTLDAHRTDYAWWDLFRNCKQPGFELSGLFAKPLSEIPAYYVWGTEPTFTLVNQQVSSDGETLTERQRLYTNREIKSWVRKHKTQLLNMLVEEYNLGDQFVFINLDQSLSIPSPDTVRVIRDLRDPETIVEAVIITKLDGVKVEEHITPMLRQRIFYFPGQEPLTETMDNILGFIPLIIFSNDKRGNELYGRPIFEALVNSLAFQHYTELLMKALEGYRVMGNPIPTFEEVENVNATIEANKPPTPTTYEDGYGTTVTRPEIAFDAQGAIVTSGKFNLKTPPVGFSDDMRRVLKALFLLICDHTRIPEYMFGGAVEASKASVETQTPPFVSYVNGRRMQLDGTQGKRDGMLDLIQMMLRVKRLTDPGIFVGDIESDYEDVTREDDQIRLQKLIYAHGNQMFDRVKTLTALRISQDPENDVKDAEKEADADAEKEMERQQEQDEFQSALNDAARREMNPESQVERPEGGDAAA